MLLAEFNPIAEITHAVHIAKESGNYNIIIGQELLNELGIDTRFSTKTICWNNVKVDLTKPLCKKMTCSMWKKNCTFHTKHCKKSDTKYKLANLKEKTSNIPQLSANHQEQLYKCLNNCAALFHRTLGLWKGDLYKIELLDGV